MTGSGHSFTPVAVTTGVMLRPGGLRAVRAVDTAAGEVTVEAGCPLRDLNEYLDARGLALANMGDIQEQTVAGAIQTGTHGTGRDLGGIAAQVTALEMVLADGSIVACSADHEPELFQAARIGLGALGVLTAVTLRVVPAFLLHRARGTDGLGRGHRPAGRADQRQRALRVLLVPAHGRLPDQAEQPQRRPGPAAAPVAPSA